MVGPKFSVMTEAEPKVRAKFTKNHDELDWTEPRQHYQPRTNLSPSPSPCLGSHSNTTRPLTSVRRRYAATPCPGSPFSRNRQSVRRVRGTEFHDESSEGLPVGPPQRTLDSGLTLLVQQMTLPRVIQSTSTASPDFPFDIAMSTTMWRVTFSSEFPGQ